MCQGSINKNYLKILKIIKKLKINFFPTILESLMSGKRTRKQKEKAIDNFKINWTTEPGNTVSEANVKRQFKSDPEKTNFKPDKEKRAEATAKEDNLGKIKRNILRSLIIVSLILGLELVVYFVWR